jgi:hypothetical protein
LWLGLLVDDGLVGVASLVSVLFDLVAYLLPELLVLLLQLFVFLPKGL